MAPLERRRLGERLLDTCFSLLVGALVLYGAVWLLRAIWPELVIVAAIVGTILGGIVWWRHGDRTW